MRPINKVVDLKNIIGRLKANQISYESPAEEVIDFVGVRGDMVVIMGEEILRPHKDALCRENHTSSIHGRVEAVRWRLEAVDSSGDDKKD